MKKTKAKISAEKEAEYEVEKDIVFFLNATERHALLTTLVVVIFLAFALPRAEFPKDLLGWAAYAFVALVLIAAVANALWGLKRAKKRKR